jgi:TonB family protein
MIFKEGNRDVRNAPHRSNEHYTGSKNRPLVLGLTMASRFILLLFVLLTVMATSSSAQDSDTSQVGRKVLNKAIPVYPDLARRMHISGVVKLRATIAPNGTVRSIERVGGNPVLIKAAQDAVTKWRYVSDPEETQETIELRFGTPAISPAEQR